MVLREWLRFVQHLGAALHRPLVRRVHLVAGLDKEGQVLETWCISGVGAFLLC